MVTLFIPPFQLAIKGRDLARNGFQKGLFSKTIGANDGWPSIFCPRSTPLQKDLRRGLGNAGQTVRLSGWVHRKRDHGQLLFIDLRDHYGITQCVVDPESACFKDLEAVRNERVITITGQVVKRTPDTINTKMATGEMEVFIEEFELQSAALTPLPL